MKIIINLIRDSKILQVGILFILTALSIAIVHSEKLSIFGFELETNRIEVKEIGIEEESGDK